MYSKQKILTTLAIRIMLSNIIIIIIILERTNPITITNPIMKTKEIIENLTDQYSKPKTISLEK